MKKIYLALALVSVIGPAQAQNDGGYNESVVVKGSYRPTIEQQNKLTFPAVISDSLGRLEHEFSYSISPSRLKALYEPSRIKAARIIGEPATKLYNNYLRLGFGNYWTPLADLYWSSTRDKKKTYGIRVNHLSSWDKLPDYGPNHFGNTGVTLFGKYIVADKLQLSSDISYEHDHNLYYGFTDSTLQAVMGVPRDSISIKDYRASYNVATWNFGLRNLQLDPNKLGYSFNAHLADLWGIWGENEFNANLSGDIHYGFNIKDKYKGIAYLHLEWDHYNNITPDGSNMPLGYSAGLFTPDTSVADILKVNPYVDFIFRGLQFRTGLTLVADKYSGLMTPKIKIYPDVTVTKKLMKDRLVLSLAATGGFEAVSLNSIRKINPFISPDFATHFGMSHYDFIGHARWTISKKLEANAEVSYSLRDDITFMLDPSYDLNNVYQVVGDNLDRLMVGGDIAFVNDEMIKLRAGGHFYHYTFTDLGAVTPVWSMYYRPVWDALLAADVNYNDKWLFHLEGQLLGKMDSDGGELPMRYGIAAEVEYRHNRALSFFLRMDNLAFQRYWYWANYPSQRGLFIAGLTYTIPHK